VKGKFMQKLIISAAAALVIAGCASMGGGDSGVDILASGNHSNMKDQQYVAFTNQADFDSMWQKAFAGQSGAPDKPVVDFSKNMVLAIFIGEQPTGGFRIRISKVDTSGADIQVTFYGIQPGQNCRHPQTSTEPFLIATIPTSTKSVDFNPQSERAPACG
jgi:PrcB C-terminal